MHTYHVEVSYMMKDVYTVKAESPIEAAHLVADVTAGDHQFTERLQTEFIDVFHDSEDLVPLHTLAR